MSYSRLHQFIPHAVNTVLHASITVLHALISITFYSTAIWLAVPLYIQRIAMATIIRAIENGLKCMTCSRIEESSAWRQKEGCNKKFPRWKESIIVGSVLSDMDFDCFGLISECGDHSRSNGPNKAMNIIVWAWSHNCAVSECHLASERSSLNKQGAEAE